MRYDTDFDREVERTRRLERRQRRERFDPECPDFNQAAVLEETLGKMGGSLINPVTHQGYLYLPWAPDDPQLPYRKRSRTEQRLLDEAAYHLRTLGLTYRQMAQKLHVSPTAARGRVKRHIHYHRTQIVEHVADVRMMDLEMLRLLTQAHSIPAIHGNRTAGRIMLQIIAQRHRLLKDERLPTQEALLKMSQEDLIPGYDDLEIDREDELLHADRQEHLRRQQAEATASRSASEASNPGDTPTLPQPLPDREGSSAPIPHTSASVISALLILTLLAHALIALQTTHHAPRDAEPAQLTCTQSLQARATAALSRRYASGNFVLSRSGFP